MEEEFKPSGDRDGEELKLSTLMEAENIRELHRLIERECDAVERSACQTAAGRALWNHVIHDPVAEILAGETYLRNLHNKMRIDKLKNARETAGVMLAVRTLWFDSRLEAALRRFKGETQVVLLGAGMDARVYRLECLKETSVFEVDFPKVIEVKTALLDAVSEAEKKLLPFQAKSVHRLAADITQKNWFDKMSTAGFDSELSTVWILEGLLYYLHDPQAKELLRTIPEKSRGHAVLLADFMNECSTGMSHELNSNFQFYSDWPEELLPTLGYNSDVRVSQIGDSDASFGLVQDPHNCFNNLRNVPRCMKRDADGMPCRRLYLVEGTVDRTSASDLH